MPDFPELPIITPPGKSFPDLPVVTPDPPRLGIRQKYGGLFYAGIAGLALSLGLVGNFAFQLWASRDQWMAIYVLHDATRPEPERIRAAWLAARHPSTNDRQRSDIALRKDLPRLARYVMAEALTPESIRVDPKGYALMVARSEGWPGWFRLLMSRPMAYAVGEGNQIALEPLDELRRNPDPALALWATYTRAAMPPGDPEAARSLAGSAEAPGPFRDLAALLREAARLDGDARARKLDEATGWLRAHHPEAREIWAGWRERDGQLVGPEPGAASATPRGSDPGPPRPAGPEA